MSQSFQFYAERARAAEAAADAAELENVRERELRSAKTWREMAERQLGVDNERAQAEVHRATRIAEEQRQAEVSAQASRPFEA